MRKAIFYDCEEVTSSLRDEALGGLPPDSVLEVCALDTVFSSADREPLRLERFKASRDSNLLDRVMDFWNSISEEIPNWEYRGLPLLKVMRYEWMYCISELYYRAWAISQLIEKTGCDEILWCSSKDSISALLEEICHSEGVNFRALNHEAPSRSLGRKFFRRFHIQAYDLKNYLLHQYWRWRENPRQKKNLESKSRTYLLAEYFPNSATLAANTYGEEFEDTKDCHVIYLAGRRSVAKKWRAMGKNPWLVSRPGLRESVEINRVTKRVCRQFREAVLEVPSEQFVLKGSSIDFKKYFIEGFRDIFPLKVRQTLVKIWQTTQALQEQPAGTVISMTYTSSFGAAISLAAKVHGSQSVYVQHGLMFNHPFETHVHSQLVLLWGSKYANTYRKSGISEDRIGVVGMLKDSRTDVEKTSESMSWPTSGPAIVYFASRTGGHFVSVAVMRQILRAIHKVVLSIAGATLIIKLHPADRTNVAFEELPPSKRLIITKSGNVGDMINQCDLAIVTSSTVGLEVCSRRKNLVMFDLGGLADLSEYKSFGAAVCVEKASELGPAVSSILKDKGLSQLQAEGQERLCEQLLGGSPNDVPRKIVDAIQHCEINGWPN